MHRYEAAALETAGSQPPPLPSAAAWSSTCPQNTDEAPTAEYGVPDMSSVCSPPLMASLGLNMAPFRTHHQSTLLPEPWRHLSDNVGPARCGRLPPPV